MKEVKYKSNVPIAQIVLNGVRRQEPGKARFPMSKKHPNRLSVTVTVGEPNRGRWPDPRNMYDARKFRIPSNIDQFVVERNYNSDISEIVINTTNTNFI